MSGILFFIFVSCEQLKSLDEKQSYRQSQARVTGTHALWITPTLVPLSMQKEQKDTWFNNYFQNLFPLLPSNVGIHKCTWHGAKIVSGKKGAVLSQRFSQYGSYYT